MAGLLSDLQASWFILCMTRRIYVLMLSADFEVAVKAPVIVFGALYYKDSSVARWVLLCWSSSDGGSRIELYETGYRCR